jgi:hypothetical protein
MSQGGQEDSAAVITYGPDGKAYGSPAEARNAGVSNPTMSPPVDVPISYPGRQPYTPAPLPSIPTQSSGGRNRYAEIMANYQQAQPYSFTNMPPSYTGGYGGYPSSYTGGFTPYQRPAPAPALPVEQNEYAEILRQLGGNDGYGSTPEGMAAREAQLRSWSETDPTGYANRNTGLVKTLGLLSSVLTPIPAVKKAYDFLTGGSIGGAFSGSGAAPGSSISPAPGTTNNANVGGWGSRDAGGGAFSGSGAAGGSSPSPSPGATNNSSVGGWGSRDAGGGEGNYKGGPISMKNLQGPNPDGPDDGYASLKDGEYVINDKAVKKYGIELMNLINSGKISKGKLRGLLEM